MPARRSFGLFPLSLLTLALWPARGDAVPTDPGTLSHAVAPSMSCQMCHSFPNAMGQEAEPPYAPFFGWQGSLMANAARDPVFWAGVAIADQDAPGETTDCIRCHAPRAFLDGMGSVTAIDQLPPDMLDGVACEVCHRMDDEGLLGNAQYHIDDTLGPNGAVPRHGPWTYRMGSAQNPPHDWEQDPFTGSSEHCGTCHDVTTSRERVDDDGMPMGFDFNEQRTYSEWAGSSFAVAGDGFASCQDCHMPAVADMPGCLNNVDQFSHPTGGRRHDLVGANRPMLQVLQGEYGDAGTQEIPDIFFDMSMDRMDELLATAATLEIDAPPEVHLGDGLAGLEVTVTNNTGHKLPTGYSEGRLMYLEVIARYGDTTVWSSGEWDEAQGGPVQTEPQLRLYEAVARDYDTNTYFHLMLNNHWLVDSRIPPLGLQPDPQTDPVGDRYVLQGDGTWPNFDVASYEFEPMPFVADATPEDASDDQLDITVRLLYIINTPPYLEFLAVTNTTNDAGLDAQMLVEGLAEPPLVVLAEQSVSVPIVGFGEAPGGSTGDSGDTAGPPDSTAGPGGDTTAASQGDDTGTTGDTEPGQNDDGGGGGCGCTTGDERAPWWLLVPLAAVARPRRRRR